MKKTLLFLAFIILAALPLKAQVIGQPVTIVNTAPGTCTTNIDLAQEYQGVIYICVGGNYAAVSTTAAGGSVTGLTATRVVVAASPTTLTNYAGFTHDGTTLTVAGLKDTALTSGRVPFATTGGLLTDSANLIFDGTTFNVLGSTSANSIQAGSFGLQSYAVNNAWLSDNLYYSSGFKYRANGYGVLLYFNAGGFDVNLAANNSSGAAAAASLTSKLFVSSAGRLSVANNAFSSYSNLAQGFFLSDTASLSALIARGTGSQSADVFVVQNVTPVTLLSVGPTGQLLVQPSSSSTIGQIIKLAAGQSADAFEILDSTSSLLAKFTSVAAFVGNNGAGVYFNNTASPNAFFGNTGNNVAHVLAVFRGMASQSGDLTQWQDSGSAVRLKVTAAGNLAITQPVDTAATYSMSTTGTGTNNVSFSTAGGTGLFQFDASASLVFRQVTGSGAMYFDYRNFLYVRDFVSGNYKIAYDGTTLSGQTGFKLAWTTSATDGSTGSFDLGISRNAAGVLEINSGTAGTLRDLTARGLTLSGNFFAGPSTIESFTTNASALGTLNYYTDSQTIYYDTAAATGNVTVAVKAAAGTNLDTRLATGQAVTVVLKITNTGTAYNIAALTIDGGAQTIKWLNGSAPAGNINAVDTYTFYIYKTGTGVFYVEGTQQSYK